LPKYRRFILVSAMAAILFMIIGVSVAHATQTETVQVAAGYVQSLIFNLDDGDKFSGSLSVSGGSGNDVDFSVTNPQGNTIVNLGRVSQGTTFEFTAQGSGAYTLKFGNDFSIFSSKTVTLSYDVQEEIIPSVTTDSLMWIILIVAVIVVLALIGFGIYASLRRSRNKPPNPPPPP
jgi:hypothetical protein